jgi:hypothetical protein
LLEVGCRPDETDFMKKRASRPYLMRGPPKPMQPRPTSVDRADPRVPEVYPRKLTPTDLERVATRIGATDPRLRAIDRCFERWAATPTGSAPGIAQVDLIKREPVSKTVPLDDAESKLVDAVVRESPGWARNFVILWYKSDLQVAQIAEALKIKRREYVYDERRIVLSYFLGRLSEAQMSMI